MFVLYVLKINQFLSISLAFASIPAGTTDLDLSNNCLFLKSGEELAQAFALIPASVTSLHLGYNALYTKSDAELAHAVAAIPRSVISLALGNNNFSEKTVIELTRIFQENYRVHLRNKRSVSELYSDSNGKDAWVEEFSDNFKRQVTLIDSNSASHGTLLEAEPAYTKMSADVRDQLNMFNWSDVDESLLNSELIEIKRPIQPEPSVPAAIILNVATCNNPLRSQRHESVSFGISDKYLGGVNFQSPVHLLERHTEITSPAAVFRAAATKIELVCLKDKNLGVKLNDTVPSLVLDLPQFKGQMILKHYSQSIHDMKDDYVSFVMAGRGENAWLPPVVAGVRCVIVLTHEEFDAINLGLDLRKAYDFLVIEAFAVKEKDEIILGRLTIRRMAALLFSSHLGLKNILMMDDNIKSFSLDKKSMPVPGMAGLFDTLMTQQQDMASPLISISTMSQRPSVQGVKPNALGSKVFLISIERIQEKLPLLSDWLMLLPEDETIWGEDYFMQCVLHGLFEQDGVNGYGVVDPSVVQLERATKHRNACKATGMQAQLYAPEMREFSKIYMNNIVTQAIEILNEGIEQNIARFEAGQAKRENTQFAHQHAARLGCGILDVPRARSPFLLELKDRLKPFIARLSVNKKASDRSFMAYPHQIRALDFLTDNLDGGAGLKLSFNIATGGGKTFIEAAIAFQALLAGNNKNVVIVCPTINLVEQTRDAFLNYVKLPMFASHHDVIAPRILASCTREISYQALNLNHSLRENGHIIVICYASFKALVASSSREKKNPCIENTKLFIFDESHLVEKQADMNEVEEVQKFGAHSLCFSATPKHHSQASFSYTREEGIRDGLLTPLIVDKSLPTDLTPISMLNILQQHQHPEDRRPISDHKGIIYVKSIPLAQALAEHLRTSDASLNIFEIHSKNPQSGTVIQNFNKADRGIAIAVDMLKEGYDDAPLDWVLLNKKTDSLTKDQIIGRTLRRDERKPNKIGLVLHAKEEDAPLTANVVYTFPEHKRPEFYQSVKQTLHPSGGSILEQAEHIRAVDALRGLQDVGLSLFKGLSPEALEMKSLPAPAKLFV